MTGQAKHVMLMLVHRDFNIDSGNLQIQDVFLIKIILGLVLFMASFRILRQKWVIT